MCVLVWVEMKRMWVQGSRSRIHWMRCPNGIGANLDAMGLGRSWCGWEMVPVGAAAQLYLVHPVDRE